MIPVAFAPPADLLRDLPDHIPTELGISAWQAGIQDGMNDVHPFTLPEFTDLQPLYNRGYATGDRTRQIARMLDSRPGGNPDIKVVVGEEQVEENTLSLKVGRAMRTIEVASAVLLPLVLGVLVVVMLYLLIHGAMS